MSSLRIERSEVVGVDWLRWIPGNTVYNPTVPAGMLYRLDPGAVLGARVSLPANIAGVILGNLDKLDAVVLDDCEGKVYRFMGAGKIVVCVGRRKIYVPYKTYNNVVKRLLASSGVAAPGRRVFRRFQGITVVRDRRIGYYIIVGF